MRKLAISLVVVALMTLLAPFAVADSTKCPDTLEITLTNHFDVTCCPGCLVMDASASDPGATSTYYTNLCEIYVEANKDIHIRIQLPEWTDAVSGDTMPADVTYKYKYTAGGSYVGKTTEWTPPDIDTTLDWIHDTDHSGYLWFAYKLSVDRSGFGDHHGTYSTTLTITASGC